VRVNAELLLRRDGPALADDGALSEFVFLTVRLLPSINLRNTE
jgi:hypothetical protein